MRPQLGQKPSARPGAPSRPRPTGLSHAMQNRRDSGTCGSAITARGRVAQRDPGQLDQAGAEATAAGPTAAAGAPRAGAHRTAARLTGVEATRPTAPVATPDPGRAGPAPGRRAGRAPAGRLRPHSSQ